MFGLWKKLDTAGLINLIAISAGHELVQSQNELREFDQNHTLQIAKTLLKDQKIKLNSEQQRDLQLACAVLSDDDQGVKLISRKIMFDVGQLEDGIVLVKDRLEGIGIKAS